MGKPKDPETSWYIEWFGGHTLEKLAEASSAEENCGRGVRCADGKPHNLWSVPYDVIRSFRSSRKTDSQLDFRIWYKSEGSDEIRLWVDYRRSLVSADERRELKDHLIKGTGEKADFPKRQKQQYHSSLQQPDKSG